MTTQIRRGNPFTQLLSMPESVEDGEFVDTFLKAEIRKVGNSLPSGYVDELDVVWQDTEEDEGKFRTLAVSAKDTSHWPLGPLEFDVKIEQATGDVYITSPKQIEVIDTVTRSALPPFPPTLVVPPRLAPASAASVRFVRPGFRTSSKVAQNQPPRTFANRRILPGERIVNPGVAIHAVRAPG